MKIGVDIDNVLSKFNEGLLNEFLLEDKNKRNSGIINNNLYITRGMFDWSKEEIDDFYGNNIERIATNLDMVDNASYYVKKLMEDKNEIYIISGRNNGEYKNPYPMTINWLSKHDIPYDKLILTNAYEYQEKADECKKNNIDIMIDDSVNVCLKCYNSNIKCILFATQFNQFKSRFKRLNNWQEVYKYIDDRNEEIKNANRKKYAINNKNIIRR